MTTRKLTPAEHAALDTIVRNAANNGYDFAIIEECVWGENTETDRKAFGALITNLRKLRLIDVWETTYVNCSYKYRRDRRCPGGFREIRVGGHPVTQITLSDDLRKELSI